MPLVTANNFSSRTWLVTPELLGVLNGEGYFKGTNPAWYATLGWTPAEIEQHMFLDFVHPDDHARTREAFVAIQQGEPILMFENRYRHKDGSYRWLSWNCVPEEGLFYCSARDVTRHHDNLSALSSREEEARFREQFIAVLGHDLRNPLSAISSAIRIVSREPQSEKATQVLDSARGSVTRMARLIDDLMDFARSRLGDGISLEKAAQQALADSLRRTVDEIRLAHRGVTIEETFSFTEGVMCDADRLQQLLSNLLSNAVKHGDTSGSIRVHAIDQADDFVLSVANSGEMIPDDVMGNLFRPFVRGEMQASQQGLGLGLFIASEIAKAHGGRLDARSDPRETVFEFRMPRRA
ncbi:PAS domain-containing sensor histidine kinase [Hyphomonas johnsonii]|uniref:histidine kinase n=1 Tax=Hyphomonas johnsonii MHS-2 TaxID=1280950 RepID=A0A059FJR8_9PROT|nr:PAS domain-containing sensor histidine kinase [Hyphomonas johnsonii]KCZ90723.1 hypothetical protein HJO_12766 [Hyphomonas johnsonii MHS-2]